MRFRFLFLGWLLLPFSLGAADLRPVIQREAAACAAAWQRNDYEGIVAYLPPRLVQRAGGKPAAIRELKEQFAEARQLGVEAMDARPGTPSTPRPLGPWLVSLVPLTAVLHGPHVDLTQATHALALSADKGRHWSFVLLYQVSQARFEKWFPELAGKITVPTDPAPSLEVVL